jgi:hypothetical protein
MRLTSRIRFSPLQAPRGLFKSDKHRPTWGTLQVLSGDPRSGDKTDISPTSDAVGVSWVSARRLDTSAQTLYARRWEGPLTTKGKTA